MKLLDLNKSVYQLTEEYPQLIEIMISFGFKDIANPVVRKTAGKLMTLEKGCRMKGLNMKDLVERLKAEGFIINNI